MSLHMYVHLSICMSLCMLAHMSVRVSMHIYIGPSLLIKEPKIKLKIVKPFTRNMNLDSFDMSGTFTFPDLDGFSFSANGTYRAPQGATPGSLFVQVVFGKVRAGAVCGQNYIASIRNHRDLWSKQLTPSLWRILYRSLPAWPG